MAEVGQGATFALPGVDQIGIVVHDVDRAIELLSTVFGLGPWDVREIEWTEATVHGEPAAFKARFGFAQAGGVQLELIQPLEGHTIYHEHLATKGEGLHHLGFLVPDLEERVAEMAKQGVGVLQSGADRGASFAYLDTAKSAGVILELIKASRGTVRYFESVKNLGKTT